MAGLKVHHLNCATLCPVGGSRWLGHRCFVCHCLLVETPGGLVLVDTGLGRADFDGSRALPWAFHRLLRPELRPEETAWAQVDALGFAASDVRHIVVTHLDVDHAGGLSDFPEATVHVHDVEHQRAVGEPGWRSALRYVRSQFEHEPRWQTYSPAGEDWFGFEAVRELHGLPPEILLVPLAGHSLGHAGVAVDTGAGWILHAGDAFFSQTEVDPAGAHTPRAITLFQHLLQDDRRTRLHNQARLRELNARDDVDVICAHDSAALRRLSSG